MEFVLPGLLFGFAAARGKFCLNSGLADVAKKDFRKVNILIFAALVQIVLMPVYLKSGFAPLPFSFSILAVVLGSVLFGMLMPLAGGCTAGIVFKAGEGSLSAATSALGFLIAMGTAYHTPLKSLINKLGSIGPVYLPTPNLPVRYVAASVGFGTLVYLMVSVQNAKADGALWAWKKTALVISFALTLHAVLAGVRGKTIGVFFVPGFIDLWSLKLSPDLFFLLGVPMGAAVTLIGQRKPAWQKISIRLFFLRLVSGFALGIAAAIAGGCSVGYGLALLPAMSLHALLAITSIFAGRLVALYFAARRE